MERVIVAKQITCIVPVGLYRYQQVVGVILAHHQRRDRISVETGQPCLPRTADTRQNYQWACLEGNMVGPQVEIAYRQAPRPHVVRDLLDRVAPRE